MLRRFSYPHLLYKPPGTRAAEVDLGCVSTAVTSPKAKIAGVWWHITNKRLTAQKDCHVRCA